MQKYHLSTFKGDLAAYVLLGWTAALSAALSVKLFQRLLDGQTRSLAWGIAAYGALLVVNYLAYYVQNLPSSHLEHGLYLEFKLDALRKMRTIDAAAYGKLGTGRLMQVIENGAMAGKGLVFNYALELVSKLLPEVILSLALIASLNMRVALFVFAGYGVVFLVTRLLLGRLQRIKEGVLISEEALNHRLVRGIMEMAVFRVHRRYASEIKFCAAEAREVVRGKTRMLLTHESFFTLFALLVAGMKLLILVYGLARGALSVGGVVALLTLIDNAYTPIAIFNVLFIQYKLDRVSFARYRQALDAPDTPNLFTGLRAEPANGGIQFASVACAYGARVIYRDLSFAIASGQVVGLAGGSGAGKSSVLKQILGLHPVLAGQVLVGGLDISKVKLDHYYRFVSYTAQEAPVFDGSLRENLVFDGHAPDSALWDALERVELAQWARSLPGGLDARVGEKGLLLSGGERQRLALARLYFQDQAKLIILDEATSALDRVTESRVLGRLLERLRGRTVLMVAHRLETLRYADRLLLFKDGGLAGDGGFDQLSRDNPYFQSLLAAGGQAFH